MLYSAMVWISFMAVLWLCAFVEMLLTKAQGHIARDLFVGSWAVLVVIIIIGTYKGVWAWVKRNAVVLSQLFGWACICGLAYFAHTVAQADLERQHQVELENIRHDMFVNNEVSK